MSSSQIVAIDTLRSLNFAAISGTYAAVGTPFAYTARLICIINNTDGDMFFSDNGVDNKLFVPRGSFKLFDLSTNRSAVSGAFVFRINTRLFVKQSTAPTLGDVFVELIYGAIT